MKLIHNKLKKEYKKINDREALYEMIHDETYRLTLTDMIIFCDYYKLPVIFGTSKRMPDTKKRDIVFYSTHNMIHKEYQYYIRIIDDTVNKSHLFSFFYYKNSGIKIDNSIMKIQQRHDTVNSVELRNKLHKKNIYNKTNTIKEYLNTPN